MKKTKVLLIILAIALTSVLTGLIFSYFEHRDKMSGQPAPVKSQRKVLYYRNPMNPEVTSPVPMKDSMGMDYVPVYEESSGGDAVSGIHISSEKQQLIGVEKDKVEKRKLVHEILAVGKIAYDPGLYTAQQEYLQALKTRNRIYGYSAPIIKKQTLGLVSAAQKRLRLLGMTEGEIKELAKRNRPQENLLFSTDEDTVWGYLAVYEYEIGLIKEGTPVKIEATAFAGESFEGKVIAINPVLDTATRSSQVRAEIKDPAHKLKPEMYINASILVDLGEKLALPESAVLDTGVRKIVYLVKEGDMLEAREVGLGQKAAGFYEVLDGLKEGDMVVTSGNFLVDSESKLKGAISSGEEKK
ncbi:MAG: efflux RND transporter periplasmic adaptor subunit [Candidatus Omnitrophica bacterium]|nr:efflux RND transporter periplasmic adaptor subunit [Candidatus Omnitrophota bacterium]